MNLERDFAKLTEQLKNNKEVHIYLACKETLEETVSTGLISKGLGYINQTQAEGTVHFIVSELISNAEQALVKRSYCAKKNTDTLDQDILKNFKKNNQQILDEWRESQNSANENIKIQYKLSDKDITFIIQNKGQVDALEKRFIDLGFKLGLEATSLEQIEEMSQGNFQGDGHGLALCVLALKLGKFDTNCLSLVTDAQSTSFTLTIPANHIGPQKLKMIDQKLVQEIKSLPAFPQQIKEIQTLCESANSDMKQVSEAIQKDPAIASQIIKLANSGGFSGGNIASVLDAVKVVGLKNIADMLLKVGALKVLMEKYNISKDFMDHPVRVGFFSRSLSKLHNKKELAEKAYVAGLLHDIGKVVLLATMRSDHVLEKLSRKRDRRNQIQLEELAVGASHAIIGSLLSQKWNFPEILRMAIEYHHTPYNSPKEFKDIIYIVYLANCMANYLISDISYYSIEPDVLAYFNMTTEESFQLTATSMENEFQSQK